jgi:hypothetical protein
MSQQKNNTILRAGGLASKKGKSPTMTIVFPVEMMEAIKQMSKQKRMTKGEVVRQLILAGMQYKTTETR